MKLRDTITTVDLERSEHIAENRLREVRLSLVEKNVKNKAMLWLLKEVVAPILEGHEFYSAEFLTWTSGLEIQFPLESRTQIHEWLDKFAEAGLVLSRYNADGDPNKRIQKGYFSKGNYLKYDLQPTEELVEELNEKFRYEYLYVPDQVVEFNTYNVDVYLEFYPTETADCAITELGTTKVEQEKTVYEFTCAEGAKELQAILNGGDDA